MCSKQALISISCDSDDDEFDSLKALKKKKTEIESFKFQLHFMNTGKNNILRRRNNARHNGRNEFQFIPLPSTIIIRYLK